MNSPEGILLFLSCIGFCTLPFIYIWLFCAFNISLLPGPSVPVASLNARITFSKLVEQSKES